MASFISNRDNFPMKKMKGSVRKRNDLCCSVVLTLSPNLSPEKNLFGNHLSENS